MLELGFLGVFELVVTYLYYYIYNIMSDTGSADAHVPTPLHHGAQIFEQSMQKTSQFSTSFNMF